MGSKIRKQKSTSASPPQQDVLRQQQPAAQQSPQIIQPPRHTQSPEHLQQPIKSPVSPQQQVPYGLTYPNRSVIPHLTSSSFSLPIDCNQLLYENDVFLSNYTGWPAEDILRLRYEFLAYANPLGVIDRDGFRKFYIASLLNTTWNALERDAEIVFRNFDANQTGRLDFNEYIITCARLSNGLNSLSPPPQPSVPPTNLHY